MFLNLVGTQGEKHVFQNKIQQETKNIKPANYTTGKCFKRT